MAAFVLSCYGNASLKSVMTILTPERRLETLDDIFGLDTDKVTVRAFRGGGGISMLKVRTCDRPQIEEKNSERRSRTLVELGTSP